MQSSTLANDTQMQARFGGVAEKIDHTTPTRRGDRVVTLTDIQSSQGLPLTTARKMAFRVGVERNESPRPVAMQVGIRFPDGTYLESLRALEPAEIDEGSVAITGVEIERGGALDVAVAIYDESGGADYIDRRFDVVPSNPLQVYAYPVTTGPSNWRGAAVFESGPNRWVCPTRWVLSNGTDHDVTFGPNVRITVSDAGLGEIESFSGNITATRVSAGSNTTTFISTTHPEGNDVAEQFAAFEDLSFRFTVQSTDGDKTATLVFAPAAHVGVTANFVGDFTGGERQKVVDIIDVWASGIYSQFDLIFTPGTPILEIPSGHRDWSRYRDIHVEENKSNICVDSDEADDLRSGWSSPGEYADRIDLFFVESFSGDACSSSLGGFSPVDGPVTKGGSNSGIVIDVKDLNIMAGASAEQVLGSVIAHEVGHFLGLSHNNNVVNNVMNSTVGPSSTGLTHDQWKTMRSHDYVRRG